MKLSKVVFHKTRKMLSDVQKGLLKYAYPNATCIKKETQKAFAFLYYIIMWIYMNIFFKFTVFVQ